VLSTSFGRLRDPGALKIRRPNGPGRALAGLVRRQRAFDNQGTNSCWTDGQFLSRVVKRDLATLGAFALKR
jgi:hypothetical protein